MSINIRPNFITFTGVDNWTDPADLAQLAADYPVEFGVLFSPDRQGVDPRYPTLDVVRTFIDSPGRLRLSAHLCGQHSLDLMAADPPMAPGPVWQERAIAELTDMSVSALIFAPLFKRVQVNTGNPEVSPARIAKWARKRGLVAILQMRNNTIFPGDYDTDWLFDQSGGRGISTTDWPREAVPTRLCGYSGGINPDNALEVCQAIGGSSDGEIPNIATNYWLDMESGVRDDDDHFSVAKCRAVCEAVYGLNPAP